MAKKIKVSEEGKQLALALLTREMHETKVKIAAIEMSLRDEEIEPKKSSTESDNDRMVVARVRSFKDPDDWYVIVRHGKRKRDGGHGVKWTCTCPAFLFGHGKPCKHMIALWKGALPDTYVEVTQDGAEVLRSRRVEA